MKRSDYRYFICFFIMLVLLIALIGINIGIGSVNMSLSQLLEAVFYKKGDMTNINIIFKIRFPRLLMAAILGGALALSGFLLQTYFANPIAGPYILGISAGAKLFVALSLIVSLQYMSVMPSAVMILAAFAGSLLSVGFVLLLAKKIKSMSALLVGGIMISYICSAITDFVITFADDSNIVNLHGWSLGSFAGQDWNDVFVAFVIVMLTSVLTFLLSKPIGAFLLGEGYAKSMGVNVKYFRVILILLSSILSATVTAFAGPISFVGIAVPQLIKRMLNTSKPVIVIPATFLGGAIFCLFADLIARTAFAPVELNISTVTAILGAPVVIAMLLKRNMG